MKKQTLNQTTKKKSILLCPFAPSRLCGTNSFLIFAFTVLFSLGAFAQSNSDAPKETVVAPANFVSDGCSSFPDGDYFDCCSEHDKAYYAGGSWTKRWKADKKLFKCVAAKNGFEHKLIAPVMWLGVRAFAVPFLPTPFRWGFGKDLEKKAKKK
ncbi:MAG: hypothetical protein ABIP06_06090, partial [Pyrinomonadaceae bacterium]